MSKYVSAFTNDAMGKLDAVGMAESIAAGKVSEREITAAAIARAEKVNEELNAIAVKAYDHAQKYKMPETKTLLSGVPTFIKDNEQVTGLPTQFGTLAFQSKPAKHTSRFVKQFLSTGLNYLGKSTMPEFGLICSTENPAWGITRNPWNTDYTTGGSSSGSAALVASGVVPIALANDGAGSIRIPASCCGLVGLKPTRDRLLNAEGVEIMPLNIVHEGVLTRTVRDTAAFFAEAEKYYQPKGMPPMGYVQHANKKKLKIAFFENIAASKTGRQDEDTYATILKTADLLTSLGHQVEILPYPFEIDELTEPFLNYYGLMAFFLKNLGGIAFKSKLHKNKLENFTLGLSNQFKSNLFSLRKSIRKIKEAGAKAESHFEKYDLIMTPVLAHAVPPIGHFSPSLPYKDIAERAVTFAPFTGMQNITGSPGISLPLGTSATGLPIGVHFFAPFGHDARLLELAYELEEAQPWKFIYDYSG
jgi:amidase